MVVSYNYSIFPVIANILLVRRKFRIAKELYPTVAGTRSGLYY